MGNENEAEKAMTRLDDVNAKVEQELVRTKRVLAALKENANMRRIKWRATRQQLAPSVVAKKSKLFGSD